MKASVSVKVVNCLVIITFVVLNNNQKHYALCEDGSSSSTTVETEISSTSASTPNTSENSNNGSSQAKNETAGSDTSKGAAASNETGQKLHHLYEHIDLEKLEESCEEAKTCPSSELYWLVCGSDDVNYLNLGLLACAQRCKKDLKLKSFGPCENSQPITEPTLSTVATSTTKQPQARELNELINKASDEEEVLEYLKNRINSRHEHRGWPPELEEWCRDNPDQCPYGYDPAINRGVYLIHAVPYEETDK